MTSLLGDEAADFFETYHQPPTAGLRVNTAKVVPAHFAETTEWLLEPVPWCPAGFTIGSDGESRPGRHPYHAAGLFYLQEPSAMAVAEALDVQPGHRVLDLAAAPGGKATHIASLLGGTGHLVANEISRPRIKPLGENLERWGATNVAITNEEPARLAALLGPVFDRVLVDAPCSGEGMFRKTPAARAEWSLEHIRGSAARQARILDDAAHVVLPGGLLLYSTCTFAPEENECTIEAFLDRHRDWELVELPQAGGIAPGRPEWTLHPPDPLLSRTARLWPHLLHGEGHFLALLRAPETTNGNRPTNPTDREAMSQGSNRTTRPGTDALELWRSFAAETLAADLPSDEIVQRGDQLYRRRPDALELSNLRVVRDGLWLGTLRPGRFEPSHAFALSLHAVDVPNRLDLDTDAALGYLAGHPIERAGPNGWVLVTVDGHALGWARRTGSLAKNHYPKGLRRPG